MVSWWQSVIKHAFDLGLNPASGLRYLDPIIFAVLSGLHSCTDDRRPSQPGGKEKTYCSEIVAKPNVEITGSVYHTATFLLFLIPTRHV